MSSNPQKGIKTDEGLTTATYIASVPLTELSEKPDDILRIRKKSLELIIVKFFQELEERKPWACAFSISASLLISLLTGEITQPFLKIEPVFISSCLWIICVASFVCGVYWIIKYCKSGKLTRADLLSRIEEECSERKQIIQYKTPSGTPLSQPVENAIENPSSPSSATSQKT